LIAENIRKFRTEKGWTLKELAERLNFTENTVSQWELGKRQPNLQTITTLTEVFGITLQQLIGKGAAGMEIANMMVLTTGHVMQETAKWLDSKDKNPIIVYPKGEYGWIIPLFDDLFIMLKELDEQGGLEVPNDLLNVLHFAYKHGCTWVMFDCDADAVDGLPSYEW
jgi:transcriptional regulator with XRE-family HTH domain